MDFSKRNRMNYAKNNETLLKFKQHLPEKPYCSNNLAHGLKICSQETALKLNYIQANHPYYTYYLILDLDYEASLVEILYSLIGIPLPNLLIENPENGRAHILFELETPIYNTDASRQKPILYAYAILRALQRLFGADVGYVGLVTKNPFSSQWRAYTLCSTPYTLDSLNSYLEITWKDAQKPVKQEEAIGLGRNCYIFHTARHWAYVEIRQYRGKTYNQWLECVIQHCIGLNQSLPQPMQYGEIKGISKSIARFCWKNDAYCYQEFIQRQKYKGKQGGLKGGTSRSKQYEKLRDKAKELKQTGSSIRKIAEILKLPKTTIGRWLKGN